MKLKIICFLFFFLLYFFLTPGQKAVSALGIDIGFDIMGQTCGVTGDENNNKCCVSSLLPNVKADLKLDNLGGGILGSLLTGTFNKLTGGLEDIINGMNVKTREKSLAYREKYFGESSLCDDDGIVDWSDRSDPETCTCRFDTDQFFVTSEEVADRLCGMISDKKETEQCRSCITGKNLAKGQGVWTGMGCIYSDFKLLIEQNVLRMGLSIGGIVALLCIVYSSIQLQVSRGDPEKIQKARERAISCISGLVIIIFSILILKIIGVDVLRIPGFGG